MAKLTKGYKCVACGATLGKSSIDSELCNICMETVMDYNADLIDKLTTTGLEETL